MNLQAIVSNRLRFDWSYELARQLVIDWLLLTCEFACWSSDKKARFFWHSRWGTWRVDGEPGCAILSSSVLNVSLYCHQPRDPDVTSSDDLAQRLHELEWIPVYFAVARYGPQETDVFVRYSVWHQHWANAFLEAFDYEPLGGLTEPPKNETESASGFGTVIGPPPKVSSAVEPLEPRAHLPQWFPKAPAKQALWRAKAEIMEEMDREYLELYEDGDSESPTPSSIEYRERIQLKLADTRNSDDTLRNIRKARAQGLI